MRRNLDVPFELCARNGSTGSQYHDYRKLVNPRKEANEMMASTHEGEDKPAAKNVAPENDSELSKYSFVRFKKHKSTTVGTILFPSFTSSRQMVGFRREVTGFLRKNPGVHLLLDFHRVRHLTVGALTELLQIRRVAESVGGKITLCSLRENVLRVFEITNVDEEFHIYDFGILARRARTAAHGHEPPAM